MFVLTLDTRGIELLLAIDDTKDGVNVDEVMLAKEEKSVVDEGKTTPLDIPYKDENVKVDDSAEVAETTTLLDVILGIIEEESLDKVLSVFVADAVMGNIEADVSNDANAVLEEIDSGKAEVADKADVVSDTDTLIVDDGSVPTVEDAEMRVIDSVAVVVTSDVEAVLEFVGTTRIVDSLKDAITLSDVVSVDEAVALFVVEIIVFSVIEAENVILSVIKVLAVFVPDVPMLPVVEGDELSVVEAVLLSVDITVMALTVVETMPLSVVDRATLSVEIGALLSMLDADVVIDGSLLVVVSMELLDVVIPASVVVVVVVPKSVTDPEVIDTVIDVSGLVVVPMSVVLKVDIEESEVVVATGSGEVSVVDVITGAYKRYTLEIWLQTVIIYIEIYIYAGIGSSSRGSCR